MHPFNLLARAIVRPVQSTVLASSKPAFPIVAALQVSTFATAPTKKPVTASKATKTTAKKSPSSSSSTKKAASATKKAAAPKKAAASSKPKKEKKEKLKPWQARGADGKLLPLPSASKPTKRTPFLIYMADRLPHLRGDSSFQKVSPKTGNKVIDIVKVTKHLGEEWKTLGASDRAKFDKVAEEEKAVYEKQMAAWQASLTPEDIRRQNAYISSQRKKGHKGHAMLRDPTKPKKPLTAFFEYLSDARSKDQDYQAGTISIRDFAKKCGETWKAMTKEEKDKYEQRAIGAFDQYKRDIEEWKKGQATA